MAKSKKTKKKSEGPSPAKAAEILADDSVRGKKLTPKQRRFMAVKAKGKKKG